MVSPQRARFGVGVLAVVTMGALVTAWLLRPDAEDRPGAAAAHDGDPVPESIAGKSWEIHSVNGRPADGGFGPAAWFRFSNDPPRGGQFVDGNDRVRFLDGHDNCNQYSAGVRWDGDRITEILSGMSTLVACPPPQFWPVPGLVELEGEWLVIQGDTPLVAFDRSLPRPTGEPPVVTEVDVPMPSEPVSTAPAGAVRDMPTNWVARAGSRWVLTSVNGTPWTSSLVPSFTIGTGTVFSGHDGCRRYVGSWWLPDPDDERLVVFASEPEDQVPCRAEIEPFLRPTNGFRFTIIDDELVSGPFAAPPDGTPVPDPTPPAGNPAPPPSTEPFVVFEPLDRGRAVDDPHQLIGDWTTLDGISVSFTADGTVEVDGCGPVAGWQLHNVLEIDRYWPAYPDCDAAASPSLAMLLLDTRSPETLELLADGRLVHTSDTAVSLLVPAVP